MSPAGVGDLIVILYVFAMAWLFHLRLGQIERRTSNLERAHRLHHPGLYADVPGEPRQEGGDHASTTR